MLGTHNNIESHFILHVNITKIVYHEFEAVATLKLEM